MPKQRVSQAASEMAEALTDFMEETLEQFVEELLSSTPPSGGSTDNDSDTPSSPTKPINSSFKLFDNIRYSGKPRSSELGLHPCKILYQGAFKIPDSGALPSESHIKNLSDSTDDQLVVLDIEHEEWISKNNWSFHSGAVEKFVKVAEWWRSSKPSNQMFGFYGVTTARNVWDALAGPGKRNHDWWQGVNDQAKPIVNAVDCVFPTIYAFHDDIPTWQKYAKANIEEARRTSGGRPVYPYIWPQFHSSAVNETPRRAHIPAKHWRAQLETCAEYADGAVIWTLSSETKTVPWSKVPPFWAETEKFLKQL